MSITITGIPFLFISLVVSGAISNLVTLDEDFYKEIAKERINFSSDSFEVEELEEKTFSTQIVDKDTLIKTLEEHGAQDIYENGANISCSCSGFEFNFSKAQLDGVYLMNVKYSPENQPNEIVKDISEEYNKNVQEITYNKIKERLEAKNLQIDDEEIYEDDTIVLTVNLE